MDYAEVIKSAEHGSKVARLIEGSVIVGIARSVGNDTGGFAMRDQDVTTLFLRVTSLSGWEHFWPLTELVRDYRAGLFVPDYQS